MRKTRGASPGAGARAATGPLTGDTAIRTRARAERSKAKRLGHISPEIKSLVSKDSTMNNPEIKSLVSKDSTKWAARNPNMTLSQHVAGHAL